MLNILIDILVGLGLFCFGWHLGAKYTAEAAKKQRLRRE